MLDSRFKSKWLIRASSTLFNGEKFVGLIQAVWSQCLTGAATDLGLVATPAILKNQAYRKNLSFRRQTGSITKRLSPISISVPGSGTALTVMLAEYDAVTDPVVANEANTC